MSEQTSTSEQRPPSNPRRKLAESTHIPADPLLDATAAAAEADLSLSAWWQAVATGRMPLPCYPRRHARRAGSLARSRQPSCGPARCRWSKRPSG
jgi:hypothetical protein